MASLTSRRFGTILSGRSNQAPPTELEVELRKHCERLRVVSHGLNGANIVLPPASSGEATLAVRVYYERNLPPDVATTMETLTTTSEDIDGLMHFQKSFALTLVFFILTDDEKEFHLNRIGSFVRRVMHRLTTSSFSTPLSNNTTRIMIVPSSEAAVEALVHFADSLKPAKRQLKHAFYEQRRQVHFLPPATPHTETTAASHVITALYEWSQINEIPDRDTDIVIQFCGSLESIVALSGTGLTGAPISQRTKNLLQQFFHGNDDELIHQARSFDEPHYDMLHNDSFQSREMYNQPTMYGQTLQQYTPPPPQPPPQQQQQQLSLGQSGISNQGWMEEPPNAVAATHSYPPHDMTMNQGQDWFYPPCESSMSLTRQNQIHLVPQQQHHWQQLLPNYTNQSLPHRSGLNQYHVHSQQQQQQQHRMYASQKVHPSNQIQQNYVYPLPQQQQPLNQYPSTQYPHRLYR